MKLKKGERMRERERERERQESRAPLLEQLKIASNHLNIQLKRIVH